MTFESEHVAVEGLLGAYALDAVDRDEAIVVEHHLESCPRCRAELDEHREMAGALGNSVEPLPPALWDNIAGRLHEAVPPRAAPELLGRQDGEEQKRRRRITPARIAGLVAVAAMVAVAVLAVNLSSSNGRIGTLQGALARTSDSAAARAALSTPGHATVSLRSPSGQQVAEVVMLPSGRGYVVDTKMAGLPAGQTYQLWALSGARVVSAAVLGHQPSTAAFTLASGSPSSMAVTVEPAGGVAMPTSSPVAAGRVVHG